jgi:hypothetical protein
MPAALGMVHGKMSFFFWMLIITSKSIRLDDNNNINNDTIHNMHVYGTTNTLWYYNDIPDN